MKKDTVFFRQAELLLRVLPSVKNEEVFALKGGTAINFFDFYLAYFLLDLKGRQLPFRLFHDGGHILYDP